MALQLIGAGLFDNSPLRLTSASASVQDKLRYSFEHKSFPGDRILAAPSEQVNDERGGLAPVSAITVVGFLPKGETCVPAKDTYAVHRGNLHDRGDEAMIEKILDITTKDGAMETFICHPERNGPSPAIFFLMDAYGVREELKDMARRLAARCGRLLRAFAQSLLPRRPGYDLWSRGAARR
jgi:hypothetical protein